LKLKKSKIPAFILSGGKSSRIGTNKSFLEFNNEPLIKRLTELLDQIFSSVVISSNEPALYKVLGKNIAKDIFPSRGPLSGIHSALSFTDSETNFIISCDLPFVSKDLIKHLINYESDAEIILPKSNGRFHHLCGIYSKSVLPEVERLLIEIQQPNCKLKGSVFELLERVNTEFIDVENLNFFTPNLFFNINTIEDYNIAKKIFEEK